MTLFFNKKKSCTFNVYCYSKNLHNFVRSKYAIYRGTLKILHIPQTKCFEKFCAINKHNCFSKKKKKFAQRNYIIMCVWSTQFFKECLIFRTFNIHNFAQSTNTIIQRNYIIMRVWSTQYFEECSIFHTFNNTIFQK